MLEQIFATTPPWVEAICNVSPDFNRNLIQRCPTSFMLAQLRGELCRSREDFFIQFARALKFPTYFGANWNAVEECVRDLEWLPAEGYVIQIDRADELLTVNESDYPIFIDVMQKAGRDWATPQAGEWPRAAIPFHVLLTTSLSEADSGRAWLVPVCSYS